MMQRRPFVLYICQSTFRPSLVEAVLARANFGVLLARTSEQAMGQLGRADVVVVSSRWPEETKHPLVEALRIRSKIPIICINRDSHACTACIEADPCQPERLVAAIHQCLDRQPITPPTPRLECRL